jgi:hypothetical protein
MPNKKLSLKGRMDRTFLIQRLSKPIDGIVAYAFGGGGHVNGGLTGRAMKVLRNVFSFDYMGSAEFEWGAIPAALEFITVEAQKEALVSGKHQEVYYLCPKSYETGVMGIIDALLTDERTLSLKEHCGLKEAINPPGSEDRHWKPQLNVGWLELDNGFFMFTDKEMFEKVKRLFGVK